MSIVPFWTPEQFIPVVGMLSGNSISAIVVSIDYVLKEFVENRDKIEVYLTFGASRLEACRPIAKQALRLALTPMISQMSVIGHDIHPWRHDRLHTRRRLGHTGRATSDGPDVLDFCRRRAFLNRRDRLRSHDRRRPRPPDTYGPD